MGGFMPTPAAPAQPPQVKLDTTATSRGNFSTFLKNMNGATSLNPPSMAPSVGAVTPTLAPTMSDIDIFNPPVQMMQEGGFAGSPLASYGDFLSKRIDDTQVQPFIEEIEQMAKQRFNLNGSGSGTGGGGLASTPAPPQITSSPGVSLPPTQNLKPPMTNTRPGSSEMPIFTPSNPFGTLKKFDETFNRKPPRPQKMTRPVEPLTFEEPIKMYDDDVIDDFGFGDSISDYNYTYEEAMSRSAQRDVKSPAEQAAIDAAFAKGPSPNSPLYENFLARQDPNFGANFLQQAQDGIFRIPGRPVVNRSDGPGGDIQLFRRPELDTDEGFFFEDGTPVGSSRMVLFENGGRVQNMFDGGEASGEFSDTDDSPAGSFGDDTGPGEFSDTNAMDTFTGGDSGDDNDDPREDTLGVFQNRDLASQLQQLDKRPTQFSGGIMSQIPSFLTTGLNFAEQKAKDFILSDLASGNFDPIYDSQGRITGSRDRNTGAVRSGMDFNAPLDLGGDSDEPVIKPLILKKEEEKKDDLPPNVIGGVEPITGTPTLTPTVVASPFAPATSKIEPIGFDSGELNKLIELLTGVPAKPIVAAKDGGLIKAVDDFLATGT